MAQLLSDFRRFRAQVASLQQATENSESAISIVQTAEGALNEVSRLLVDIRQRTVAAAKRWSQRYKHGCSFSERLRMHSLN